MQVRNSITLIGNLGAAPLVRTTENGLTITEFSLATNETFRDKNGDRQTRTDWHKIVAFGKLAEVFGKYLDQGSQVCIAGALRYNKWIDKHDQVRLTAEIIAHSFTFLSGGKQQEAEDELAGDEEISQPEKTAKPTAAKAKSERTAKTSRSQRASSLDAEPLPF
jgi:single-strand DNA-binding protein